MSDKLYLPVVGLLSTLAGTLRTRPPGDGGGEGGRPTYCYRISLHYAALRCAVLLCFAAL